MLVTLTRDQLAQAGRNDISDALERGGIVHFPECPIELPSQADLDFLRQKMPAMMKSKNVSYHPESGRIYGLEGDPADVERAHEILKEHIARVVAFLEQKTPQLTQGWTVGTASFRPLQERGRALSAHASNELIHVDAMAYGATHGDRVLRFFVNANDHGADRVWTTKGTFPELFNRYGTVAGVTPPQGKQNRLEEGFWDKVRTAIVNLLARFNPGAKTALDSSPYDRLMRRFHNYMKDTPEFQNTSVGHQEFRFKPYSAWMTFTDMVSHACIEGQHAFADTFVVPLDSCRLKEVAPYYILKGKAA
ncbi:MAG: Kdo hydroxylase family protein [Nevskiales bacterium]